MKDKEYYLNIDGRRVSVSREVYLEYKRSKDKEDYFMGRLKKGRSVKGPDGQAAHAQGREISYEQLLEAGWDFPVPGGEADDALIKAQLMDKLEEALHSLTDEEMALIQELFYLEKSEREACDALDMAKSTLHRKKGRVLKKLRKKLENF